MEIKQADKKYYFSWLSLYSQQSKVLKKFESLKVRKMGLYVKAYDIMSAVTAVLTVR